MFDYQHYVPVMRMKPAELRALRDLNPALRSLTTPILECPPRVLRGCDTPAKLEKRTERFVEHLVGWTGRSVFIDFSMLPSSLTAQSLEAIAAKLALAGIRPALIVSLKTGSESTYARSVRTVLDRHGSAICLKVSPEELKLSRVDELIQARLKLYGASPASADLVVDRGGVDGQSYRYEDFAHFIPWLSSWRTLTCLAGSFPEDLSRLAAGRIHRLQRFEWQHWRLLQSWPGRRPSFGDYAIQHVLFKEPVAVPNYSASIRYTTENEFLVLRGEGVLNERGPGFGQYNGWAKLLIGTSEYFGATFSAGDHYVAERAANWKSSGSAQSWLQAGLSHHVTATALQVAGLLQQVRLVTATATVSNWSSVVDVSRPQAVV
jgi:hypothetical protein